MKEDETRDRNIPPPNMERTHLSFVLGGKIIKRERGTNRIMRIYDDGDIICNEEAINTKVPL